MGGGGVPPSAARPAAQILRIPDIMAEFDEWSNRRRAHGAAGTAGLDRHGQIFPRDSVLQWTASMRL